MNKSSSAAGVLLIKIKEWSKKHKITSSVIAFFVLYGTYYFYTKYTSTSGEVRYLVSQVTRGTIVSSISGSGQISALNQIDIKPKVSGTINWIGAIPSQNVKTWTALMTIDSTDAKRSVLEAEQSLITSKLQYQKDLAQSPIDYQKTLDNLTTAKSDLSNTFNDTFNSLSNSYLDLPNIMTVTQNVLYGYDLSTPPTTWNIDVIVNYFNSDESSKTKINLLASRSKSDYITARTKYDQSIINFKQISRITNNDGIEKMLDESIDTSTSIAQALQDELNLIGTAIDSAQTLGIHLPSTINTIQTNARNQLSTLNNDLSNLLSQKKAIVSGKENIKNYEDTISILKVGNPNGDNPISLQISKNNIDSQQVKLEQMKADLSNYSITSPFDGVVAMINVKKGDSVSTGTSLLTMVTKQQVAEISLNEVDVAKVKVGQKATLNFDAIENLLITGVVSEIDTIGTVSQGVVTYTVKINLDSQDDRIKPGMSVNANIITDVKQDVLMIPNSAVKTSGATTYIETFATVPQGATSTQGAASSIPPIQKNIQVGLSNDTSTEVISGLNEGDNVVTRTITTTATTNTAPSILSSLGGNRNANGTVRRIGG